ncbi:MAG: hypothetical protein KA715_02540 [Xanthomonadaceae bacterium]|nr:hypothetical protein [Xanthomonadaceae bacterium]
MKSIIVLFSVLLATSSQADTLKSVINRLNKFEGKTGEGLYTKNKKVIYGKKNCYVAVNNIDSWSSDNTVTADIFEITVGSKQLGTDLQSWDFNKNKVKISNGFVSYFDFFEGKNKCKYYQQLTFTKSTKDQAVLFIESKDCKNGVKTKETLTCSY